MKIIWEMVQAQNKSAALGELLMEGWEPFAATQMHPQEPFVIWLKRQMRLEEDGSGPPEL